MGIKEINIIIKNSKLAFVGLIFVVAFVIISILAPFIVPYNPLEIDLYNQLKPPSREHIFGTDELGRDILSRIIYGGRISLSVSFCSVSISLVIGLLIGLISGYKKGIIDIIFMRLMDVILSFPTLILALAISATLGPKLINIIIAIGIVYIPQFARLTRGQVLKIRNLEYIRAIEGIGASNFRIMVRHILPNVILPIIAQIALNLGYAILVESSLSFLGVGAQPPAATWGTMLKTGYPYLEIAPWLSILPGMIIFIVAMSFNFIGDGLNRLLSSN